MVSNRLRKALGHLQLALAPPEGDGPLLARFVACRDEAAFAALVRRHGPMVLGVCRRVLRHAQDAEDAFQATFLVLARKAGAVLKGEAVGSWLYAVAYRTARHVKDGRARQWARERQVDQMPHPQVFPEEAQDWRPVLDDELGRLPEKYRAPVVLCDLQGQSRREAARQLRLPDGTLSRRLAAGRRLLAERLSRRGVALSCGALAAALSGGAASATVAAPLVVATAKAAVFAAVGHLAAVSTPVAVLTRGVLRAMFLAKLKVVLGVVLVVVALGAGGVAYRTADAQSVQPPKRAEGKPQNELEALRKEVELLRLNLLVVLEKVRAQEAELRTLRAQPKAKTTGAARVYLDLTDEALPDHFWYREPRRPDLAQQAEAALKALREAKDNATRQRAVDALERALRRLRERPRQPGDTGPRYYEPVPEKKGY